MKRSITALAFISLAGCAWMYTPQRDITGTQFQYQPGNGTVESVSPAPAPFSAGAAAGGSGPERLNRLKIRMDDGRTQYIDTDAYPAPGTRVRLTEGRLIEKP